MAATLSLVISINPGDQDDWIERLKFTSDRRQVLREVTTALNGVRGGARRATVCVHVDDGAAVAASQTVTMDQAAAVDGTDDITFDGETLSVETTPANEDEFAKGADDIEFAANLAAAINAHTVLKKRWVAESDGVDTVTITSLMLGDVMNGVAIAETGTGMTLGAATFTGGTKGPQSTGKEIHQGKFGT